MNFQRALFGSPSGPSKLWLALGAFAIVCASVDQSDAQEIGPFAAFDIASEQILNDPHDLEIGPDGLLYVADKFGGQIAVFDPETLSLIHFIGDGGFAGIHDISFAENGDAILAVTGHGLAMLVAGLTENEPDTILAYSAPRTEGALAHSNGRIYAMASGIGVLAAFEGQEVRAIAQGLGGAHDVEEAPDGTIWVADNARSRLVQFSQELEQLSVLDQPIFGFIGPRYLDIDEFGRLIVADQDAHRVLMIEPGGANGPSLIGVLGDGLPGLGPNKFDDPEGVEVWGNSYFISDSDNNRIVRYTVALN